MPDGIGNVAGGRRLVGEKERSRMRIESEEIVVVGEEYTSFLPAVFDHVAVCYPEFHVLNPNNVVPSCSRRSVIDV